VSGPHDKGDAQFWVAIVSVAALALITAGSLIADRFHGSDSQVTTLLAGGLISTTAASASWLFRNGNSNNGSGPSPEPPLEDRLRLAT
jgi:hypothetical protein